MNKISKKELNIALKECKKGNHDLVAIYWHDVGYGAEHVVRACNWCGAVVIDVDVDNRRRHNPGGVYKMRGPIVAGHKGY